jgi:putative aminopeptidase FrvX
MADLAVLKSDGHGFVRLSEGMAEELGKLAADQGYRAEVKKYPFGGGGTDAASFAKAGLDAVSIVAMPTSLFRGSHIYHTPRDTSDRTEPGAVQAVCDIVASYILKTDETQGKE